MHEIQVNIFYTELFILFSEIVQSHANEATHVLQTVLNGGLYVQPIQPRILGSNEEILASKATLVDSYTSFSFVPVCLGGI